MLAAGSCRGRASARPRVFGGRALAVSLLASRVGAFAVPAPKAVVPEARYDFGRVKAGERIVHRFAIRNEGTAILDVTGAELSMKGMSCRTSRPVSPGAEGAISVEWDTLHIQGKLRGQATVRTNDPAVPAITLELSGEAYGPLEIEPMPALFLSTFQDEDVRRELTLRSNQDHPISIRLGGPRSPRFLASLAAVEPGRLWRLTVLAAPRVPPGRYEETLGLESDDPAIGHVRLPVHLFVKADLYANPDEVDFGDVPLDRIRRDPGALPLFGQTLFVKKRKETFRVLALRCDVAALDVRATPSAVSSDSFQIDVSLRPDLLHAGSLEGTIRVDTDDPKFPHIAIRVHGRVT